MNLKERFINPIKTILGHEVIGKTLANSGWLVGNKIFTMVIGVFITSLIARYFGPTQYGQFNYALSFTELFTILSTLGLETLTVKSIVDKQYDEGTILCTSLFLRVFGGIILTLIATLIIGIIEPSDKSLQTLVLIMSFMMVVKATEVIEYWIQAYQRAKISSIIRAVSYIISSGLKVALVFFKGNLFYFALIYMVDAVIVGIGLAIAYFKVRENKNRWKFNGQYAKNILGKSSHLILAGLMVTLYMRMDQVMLGKMMSSKAELGIYSAAVQIATMWYFVPLAVITSFQPIIMSRKKTGEESYLRAVQSLYAIMAWMGILFGIVTIIFSNLVISVLFGPAYLKAAGILSVSVWAGTFAMLGSAQFIWLLSEGLQRYSVVYTAVGFVVNLLLNLVLIPRLGGYGAAIATLCAQFAANVLGLAFFKKTKISTVMILKSFSPKSLLDVFKLLGNKSKEA